MRFLLALWLVASSAFSLGPVTFRPDLAPLGTILCRDPHSSLESAGIFDAQAELAFIQGADDLKFFARDFAKENRHRGYAYGTCPDRRQWVLSTPAPSPVLTLRFDKSLALRTAGLRGHCASFDVDALRAASEFPLELVKGAVPGNAPLSQLPKDLTALSITCHPLGGTGEGTELWALYDRESGHRSKPDLRSSYDLLQWIQAQRIRNNLPRLAVDFEALEDLAERSAAQGDLHHPKALLLTERAKFAKQGIHLLGENRAVATTFAELADLLWSSPQHRRLLLHPDATRIALYVAPKAEQKLLVMILAKP